tara:strand:+ start:2313 stop:3110 length:798 start_codon:yes stop_codon:yes gene_type:complete
MSFTNKTISNTYKDILYVDNSNNGIPTAAKEIKSGDGTNSCLKISDDQIAIQPQNDDTTDVFSVKATAGSTLLQADSTNSVVKALGQYVNTGVKEFHYASVNSKPSSANTWSALDSSGGGRFRSSVIELGTGSTPTTSYDVSGGNIADDFVQSIWHVPFNITIDAVRVWKGADASSGDAVKYSIMSYDVSTATDATGGDLSNGAEHAASPSTISTVGYDRAIYQSLTISSADVNQNKVILACVHQDGTNADLTVNMQLIYHLRST